MPKTYCTGNCLKANLKPEVQFNNIVGIRSLYRKGHEHFSHPHISRVILEKIATKMALLTTRQLK